MNHAWLNTGLLLLAVFFGAYVLVASRRWTAPAQTVQIDALRDEQRVLRANHLRLERDVNAWKQSLLESIDQIFRRLEDIQASMAREHPIEEELRTLTERITDMEQTISALPCAEHMAAFVKPTEPKK